jgi:membrane associated rhomboid family serine protease
MNWLILVAIAAVFVLQIREAMRVESAPSQFERRTHNAPGAAPGTGPTEPEPPRPDRDASQATLRAFVLDGWSLRGLLGYMWLHGGILHLLGNMWFLWLFGNAVCAKVGNLRYLSVYVLLGVAAGVVHLLGSSHAAIGASGAINGIVGMYLFLFFENDITCYWSPIIIYWRQFTVSSFWMILFWLFWDVIGVLRGSGTGVAYLAHVGGFGAGFAMAWLMCHKGWIVMEPYERSLLQMWQERCGRKKDEPVDSAHGRPGRCDASSIDAGVATAHPITSERRSLKERPSRGVGPAFGQPPLETYGHPICQCGHKMLVSRQYAGKTIVCPKCQAHVEVPDRDPSGHAVSSQPLRSPRRPESGPASHIHFACSCGQKIKVSARQAGRHGACPRCGVRVTVPSRS